MQLTMVHANERIGFMLDKKDFKTIESLIQKNVKNALIEFFDTLVLPYFEHNEKDHKEIKEILARHEKLLEEHEKLLEENDNDHDKMLRMLERNQDEHDEIFVKLDNIERHVTNHEKRIKRVETITAS